MQSEGLLTSRFEKLLFLSLFVPFIAPGTPLVSVSEPKPHMDRPFKPPAESQQLKAARERWEARRDAWVAELGGNPLSIMGKETEDEG